MRKQRSGVESGVRGAGCGVRGAGCGGAAFAPHFRFCCTPPVPRRTPIFHRSSVPASLQHFRTTLPFLLHSSASAPHRQRTFYLRHLPERLSSAPAIRQLRLDYPLPFCSHLQIYSGLISIVLIFFERISSDNLDMLS